MGVLIMTLCPSSFKYIYLIPSGMFVQYKVLVLGVYEIP